MTYHNQQNRQQHYAIRKMTTGIGSVLIGIFFLAGQTATVHAAETSTEAVVLLAENSPSSETKVDLATIEETHSSVTNPPKLPTTSPETLKETIANLPAPNYYDNQQATIPQQDFTIKFGETVQLSLIAADGTTITDQVNWYVKTKYPEDKVYQSEEVVAGEHNSQLLHLEVNGNLTNLNNQVKTQRVDVFAHYNQHLYHASIKLPGTSEMEAIRQNEEASKVADDIIKNFVNLSDVEKVKAAHDWLVENVHYVDRPGKDQTAYSALVEKQTVCAGYANALKLMLDKMGIPNHTKMGTITGGELHLWNIVELDGQWYHVDPTWDYPGNSTRPYSQDRGYNHKNKYLLIHDQDFSKASGAKRDYSPIPEEKAGERYRYYGFEKKGILAKTLDDVGLVLERQYQKVPFKAINTILEVMAPSDLSLHHIGNQLVNILGHAHYSTYSENYGGYKLHRFAVKLFPSWSTKDVEPVVKIQQLKIDDTDNTARVSSLLVTLDQAVDLTTANFTITDAKLIQAIKVSPTTYKLILDQPKQVKEATVTVGIHKRKYQFQLDTPTLAINVKQAETPKAIFTATGENQGILSNVTAGMEYRIGPGNWIPIEGDRVEFNDIGLIELYLRQPETEHALSSAIQHIDIKKTPDPVTAKAFSNQIVGVNQEMEYRHHGDGNWQPISGNLLTGLTPGTYDIRTRATGEYLASNIKTITLETLAQTDPRGDSEQAANRHLITPLPMTITVERLLAPADFIANPNHLPEGTTFSWEGTPPDFSRPGSTQYPRVRISFSDGSFKIVRSRLQIEPTMAQLHTTTGIIPENLSIGASLNPAELITNHHSLPKGTTFNWGTRPNLMRPGGKVARIRVTFPDGSHDDVVLRFTLNRHR